MSKTNPTVYLAGPIAGLSRDNFEGWRTSATKALSPEIVCFSPLRGKQYLDGGVSDDSYLSLVLSQEKAINERDHFDCWSSDLILVNLVGAKKVSIGTVMEIAWGKAYRKPVVLAMESGNIHDHAMLRESASFIVNSIEDAIKVTRTILLPAPDVRQGFRQQEKCPAWMV